MAITLEFRARVGELERLAHGLVRGGQQDGKDGDWNRGRLGTRAGAG